jgi:peptidyl-prolyl cis-trans isomerase D|tara:strand:- start:303 stop:1724 length:1422 start_codon:yes stop_codon:yes gene_type:complete
MKKIFNNFTKKKFAGLILILVIIIAFGFGGFGGGFNLGNQNNIAKINNKNISTQDFMNYLNKSGLSQQVIKENINEGILEELLSALVSTTLLDLEINDLNLLISEEIIIQKLKMNKSFQDKNGNFQRTIYEKFLLTNNMNAPTYEIKLKNNILQKQLFTYISGGAKSPSFFVKNYYKEENKKLDIEYLSLKNYYKKKDEFTNQEIQIFIDENEEKLKQDYIDFSYIIITPKNLIGIDEFNQNFFDKIDDIENKIAKNVDYDLIVKDLNIKINQQKEYINIDNKETIENKIYNSKKNKIQIIEDNNRYIFYNINKVNTKLPSINNNKFNTQIKKLLFQKEKFEFNKSILEKIDKKDFNQISFDKLANGNTEKIKLDSINDIQKFEAKSVEILYALPINTFTLVADEEDNIFIAKPIKSYEQNISENSEIFNTISNEASAQNRNSILKSYDYILNNKYKVVVNEKTLDRVKNYFR